jgi:hypothetical protein
MRKFLIFCMLALCAPAMAVTSTLTSDNVSNVNKVTAAHPVDSSKYIMVYDNPADNAKVVDKLDPTTLLVPIYRQGQWLKVGNPNNGDVGWINIDQYRKLIAAFSKSQVQNVFVQTVALSPSGDGKKTVVYENGKQVNDKRAAEIIKQMNTQQKELQERMTKFNDNMQKMFDESMQNFNKLMMDMPTIVITPPR